MEVKWIKIDTTMYDDAKIKLIDGLPNADKILTIWVKLLCLAGKLNNDGVFVGPRQKPYTAEMLGAVMCRDTDTVKMALDVLEEYELIDIIDGVITIPNWGKHQSIDKLQKQREYQKNYKRAYRQRQKALIEGTAIPQMPEPESEPEPTTTFKPSIQSTPDYLAIIDYLNEKCGTSFRPQTKKTQQLIKARMNEGYSVDDFKSVIDRKASDWKNDPKMSQYLRPETLFGNKFESYLVSHDMTPVTHTEPKTDYYQ